MESASRGWILIAAILGGLLLIVILLAAFAFFLGPRAYSAWYQKATERRQLISAPVGPFTVPSGYTLLGGGVSRSMTLTAASAYRMGSTQGFSPDVLTIAAFQDADVAFDEAWLALGVPNCSIYAPVQIHPFRVGKRSYDVESLECAEVGADRRAEFILRRGPPGSEVVMAWGRASDWRERPVKELVTSLGP